MKVPSACRQDGKKWISAQKSSEAYPKGLAVR
jgi:hypothetical protein